MKQWKVTYELLYTSETEPTRYEVEFMYFDTVIVFLKNTKRQQNLLSFTVERIK